MQLVTHDEEGGDRSSRGLRTVSQSWKTQLIQRDIKLLLFQDFLEEEAGVQVGSGQCHKVGRPNLLCRETSSCDGTGVSQ